MQVSDEIFEKLLGEAMDSLPEKYIKNLNNVVITYEEKPSSEQKQELKLRGNQTLFGLYQGIPRTKRGIGYNMVLPDKITLFTEPLLRASTDMNDLKNQIRHTLWHEIAHHYGLDHERIHELER